MPLKQSVAAVSTSRYALLRSCRTDGTAVDTPIWFAVSGSSLVFRTKRGPKTARLRSHPDIELRPCDHRGAIVAPAVLSGRATILVGDDAEAGNALLHRRYGWQWNIVPLLKLPGVTNVHAHLPLREKLRRARSATLWEDSAIVRIDLA